jgi:AcrR family transcriptional regulator
MTAASRGGRPQDPEADRRILEAAMKVIATEGFGRMSIERVAAEAGVAKTTVYRRFRDKADLATAVIAEVIPLAVPGPTDDVYADLLAQLDFNRRTIDMALPGALLAEERRNPQLLEHFRAGVLQKRIEILRQILEGGIERGELRADLDLDATADLVMGTFLFRYFAEGRPDEGWPRRVVDTLWPALKAP